MSITEALGIQKQVELAQGIIEYRECGAGETLLFIHGFLVNGDLWRKVVPVLSQKFHCVVPDLPLGSHAQGCNPMADLTPTGLARLISDFITSLGLTNVTLVGNDTGGALCQIVATQYPQHIKRLILTNCDAFENFPAKLVYPFVWGSQLPGAVFVLGQLLRFSIAQKALMFLVAKTPLEPAVAFSYSRPLAISPATRHDTRKMLKGTSNRYTKAAAQKFASFQNPVLLVWGKADYYLFPTKYAERLKQAFPNARLEYVDSSRCFVPEDQPAPLIAHILDFMAS